MDTKELLKTFIEIEPLNYQNFKKVCHTLRRIGMPARKDATSQKRSLIQTCHVLQKQGQYYLVHFKQMFLLDGRHEQTDYNEDDVFRTETIAALLESWGLITLKSKLTTAPEERVIDFIIISRSELPLWHLKSKYTIGNHLKEANHETTKTA